MADMEPAVDVEATTSTKGTTAIVRTKSPLVKVLLALIPIVAMCAVGGMIAGIVIGVSDDDDGAAASPTLPPSPPPPSVVYDKLATPLSIVGSWNDGYGGDFVVTPDKYISSYGPGVSTVLGYGANHMYLRTGVGTYQPDTFQKIEWTWNGTVWYMCTVTSGHETVEAMLAATPDTHLWNGVDNTCGQFSNSKMSPNTLSIVGSWNDGYGGTFVITPDKYTSTYGGPLAVSTVLGYGTKHMYLHTGVNTYQPDTFQKIEWTWNSTVWYMCTVTSGHETVEAMLAATPDTHLWNGVDNTCGQFSNSKMSPIV